MSYYKRGLTVLGGPVTVLGTSWDPAPSVDDVLADKAPLRKGQKGDAVSKLQRFLGIHEDGEFGKDTETAVKAFQAKYTPSDVANGVVGGALFKLIMTTPASSASSSSGGGGSASSGSGGWGGGSADDSGGVIDYIKSLPTWQLVLGGVGILAVGYATYRLVAGKAGESRRKQTASRVAEWSWGGAPGQAATARKHTAERVAAWGL